MGDITRDTIDKILELARSEIVTVDGRKFSTIPLTAVMESTPNSLAIATLTALVEYVKVNFDEVEAPVVHVESPNAVKLVSSLFGPFDQRKRYIHAENINKADFRFGQYYDAENFIIALQSQFQDTTDRKAVLALLGNVRDENVQTWGDDGVTQSVTAKTGIALVKETPVPNPVMLRPFRTFLEVEQPESPFILRVRSGKGEAPECSLHEADGGLWRLTAISAIREYIKAALPEVTVLA